MVLRSINIDVALSQLEIQKSRPNSILIGSKLSNDAQMVVEYPGFLSNYAKLLRRRAALFYYYHVNSPGKTPYSRLWKETDSLVDKSQGWNDDVPVHQNCAFAYGVDQDEIG